MTSDNRSNVKSAYSRTASNSVSRFAKVKGHQVAKMDIDQQFLLDNEVGKSLRASKTANRGVYAPLDRYTTTADTHFKYSVYNMKRDVNNTAVQRMAIERHHQ